MSTSRSDCSARFDLTQCCLTLTNPLASDLFVHQLRNAAVLGIKHTSAFEARGCFRNPLFNGGRAVNTADFASRLACRGPLSRVGPGLRFQKLVEPNILALAAHYLAVILVMKPRGLYIFKPVPAALARDGPSPYIQSVYDWFGRRSL